MRPSFATRPAFFAAVARPRLRRIVFASSTSPLASVRAFLHSIMPAPVWSRSFLTCSAVIVAMIVLRTEKCRPATRAGNEKLLAAGALGGSGSGRRRRRFASATDRPGLAARIVLRAFVSGIACAVGVGGLLHA